MYYIQLYTSSTTTITIELFDNHHLSHRINKIIMIFIDNGTNVNHLILCIPAFVFFSNPILYLFYNFLKKKKNKTKKTTYSPLLRVFIFKHIIYHYQNHTNHTIFIYTTCPLLPFQRKFNSSSLPA